MLVCDILRLLPPEEKHIYLKVGFNIPNHIYIPKVPKEYLFSKVNSIGVHPIYHTIMITIGFADVIRNEQEYL